MYAFMLSAEISLAIAAISVSMIALAVCGFGAAFFCCACKLHITSIEQNKKKHRMIIFFAKKTACGAVNLRSNYRRKPPFMRSIYLFMLKKIYPMRKYLRTEILYILVCLFEVLKRGSFFKLV
jgi:hypothetical protein